MVTFVVAPLELRRQGARQPVYQVHRRGMARRDGCCGGVPSVLWSRVGNAVHVCDTWLHMHVQDNDSHNATVDPGRCPQAGEER